MHYNLDTAFPPLFVLQIEAHLFFDLLYGASSKNGIAHSQCVLNFESISGNPICKLKQKKLYQEHISLCGYKS